MKRTRPSGSGHLDGFSCLLPAGIIASGLPHCYQSRAATLKNYFSTFHLGCQPSRRRFLFFFWLACRRHVAFCLEVLRVFRHSNGSLELDTTGFHRVDYSFILGWGASSLCIQINNIPTVCMRTTFLKDVAQTKRG